MVHTHKHSKTHQTTTGAIPHQQETVITTRTTEMQQAPGALIQKAIPTQMINKEAVITNVMEKPILANVIEQKEVEIHHKPVVQEIHEQKIIEIEKQAVVQNVQQAAQFSSTRAETRFEEIGSSQLGEQERLRLSQLQLSQAPKIVQQQGLTQQIQEKEVVGQVIKQEFIEKHVQPVITEVREQKIVQEVVHPVVRKVYEAPIVREVTSTVAPTVIQGTTTIQQGTQFQQGSTFVQQPVQTGFVQQTTVTEKQGLGQKLTGAFHGTQQQGTFVEGTQKQGLGQKISNVLHGGSQQQGTFQQSGFSQQPIQSGYQQGTFVEGTQKQGLGQKLTGLLHHNTTTTQQPLQSGYQQGTFVEGSQKQGLGQKLTGMLHHGSQQQGTFQQSGYTQQPIQQQTTFTQQPLQQGALRQGVTGSTFQSNNALLQNQGLGNNLTTTTSTQHWGSNVTTSTVNDAELNMINHEQKVINKEGGHLTSTENANLRQHDAVVEAVASNPGVVQQLQNQGIQGGRPVNNL